MSINKSAANFIISRLKEMANEVENIRIRYSYDDIAGFHVIEVAPSSIRYDAHPYIEMEAALWKDFAKNYPNEEISIDEFDDLNDVNEMLYKNTQSLEEMPLINDVVIPFSLQIDNAISNSNFKTAA
ncbi:MAG: hypothetical protein LBM06_08905 [Prevotellaceae bacterium]|jgi:hypothetical protein|nr:hypothetical protein [Prevotellaceae bacterium]